MSHEAARVSPRTARNFYGYPLKALLVPFCEQEEITAVNELGPEVVDRFAGTLYDRPSRSGKPLARATVLAYLKAVKHFLTWAQAQGVPVDGGGQLNSLLVTNQVKDGEAAAARAGA